MADEGNEQKTELKPIKSILKPSTSFDKASQKERKMKWDEMNILATFHPEGKEYGHNKIDEPPTPYNYMSDMDGDETEAITEMCTSAIDPVDLASKLEDDGNVRKDTAGDIHSNEESDEDEEEMEETEEEKHRRMSFEEKRKLHYNEFYAMKLAQQLMDDEDDEEEENNDKNPDLNVPK